MSHTDKAFKEISKELLQKGVIVRFPVSGGSMRPFLRAGDVVSVTGASHNSIHPGDIVLHSTRNDTLAVHRVIAKKVKNSVPGFWIKGDAVPWPAEFVGPEQLFGKVFIVGRGLRTFGLESLPRRIAAVFWLIISWNSFWIYPLLRFLKKSGVFFIRAILYCLQNIPWYRVLVKTTCAKHFSISIAKEEDAVVLAAFYGYDRHARYLEELKELKNQLRGAEDSRYIIARKKNRIVGSVSVGNMGRSNPDNTDDWRIDGLLVDWACRGRGIGTALVRMACAAAADKKAGNVFLIVGAGWSKARALYAKSGFSPCNVEEQKAVLRRTWGEELPGFQVFKKAMRLPPPVNRVAPGKCMSTTKKRIEAVVRRVVCTAYLETADIGELSRELVADGAVEFFCRYCADQGVAGLLYKKLLSQKNELTAVLPDQLWAELHNRYYATVYTTTLILDECRKISEQFVAAGIPAIILKGPYLAETVYNDIGLRPMSDIDILVPKPDIDKVNAVLNALDYSSPKVFADACVQTGASSMNSLFYRKRDRNSFAVHIHWHIINSSWPLDFFTRSIDMAGFWEKARPVSDIAPEIQALSVNHCLLYLLGHAFTHGFDRLILAEDIRRMVRSCREEVEWPEVIALAQEYHCAAMVRIALGYINECLRMDCGLKPLIAFSKPEQLCLFLLRKGVSFYCISYWVYFSQTPGLVAKIKFLFRTVCPPKFVLASMLNKRCSEIGINDYGKRVFGKLPGLS